MGEIEIRTAELLTPESTLLEAEIAIGKLKKFKFSGILQNLYKMAEIHYLLKSTDIHSTVNWLRRNIHKVQIYSICMISKYLNLLMCGIS